jgi:tRNA modification GTPase
VRRFTLQATDTIVALSTPHGRSGIGIIRLSGSRALELSRAIIGDDLFEPEPFRVSLKNLHDLESGQVLDRALVTYFKSPHSFTGEDVIEFSCHGSPPLLLRLIDLLLHAGARAAEPGEFTLRALSNGRLNLSQAEAVRDLIEAQTLAAVQQAARQLGGELSHRLQPIKEALLNIIVPLESAVEFVEDDLPDDVTARVLQQLDDLITQLDRLSNTFGSGRLLKDGLKVTLIGRPNVGKSSIFNYLLARERAIVTEIPGTTRDTLSEVINLNDVPVLLTDTAGLRTSTDRIERLGIEKTQQALVDADLILVVLDGSQPLTEEDRDILKQASSSRFLIVFNKKDLDGFSNEQIPPSVNGAQAVSLSAKTGEGFVSLCDAMLEPFKSHETNETGFLITNARHFDLLRRAADSLKISRDLLQNSSSEELSLTGLHDALRFLGEITGETTPEDILSQIFATFCIGK